MDRWKEFLRTKGLYVAIGTGVLAFVGLMVVYNYNTYKSEFGAGEVAVDLNAPEETTEQTLPTKVESADVTETNSNDAIAGNTDAEGNIVAENTDAKNEKVEGNTVVENESAEENTSAGNENAEENAVAENMDAEVAETNSDGVIVNADGVVVANSYNEGTTLVWPVEGTVLLPFSMDTTVYYKTLKSYRCNPGLLISAEEGENVLAAYEGVVESITEDKEHGTTVTIIMGNGYKAMYGQLMNVTVAEGDTVATAQNIGEVAAPSSYYTEEGTHVFFELVKNNVPVNPTILMQ